MDDKLKALFEQNNGYLLRSQLPDKGTYNHLLSLVRDGIVDRVKQGVYHYVTASFDNTMIDVEKVNRKLMENSPLSLFVLFYYRSDFRLYPPFHSVQTRFYKPYKRENDSFIKPTHFYNRFCAHF